MGRKKMKHKEYSNTKKIGIIKIVPIFLALMGAMLLCVVIWLNIIKGVNISRIICEKSPVNIRGIDNEINNKVVHRPLIGEEFGILEIPSIKLNNKIYEGDNEEQFSIGIGHTPTSLMPGEGGNIVLASHRDGYFAPLQNIKEGDEVIVTMNYGTYHYIVSKIWIADKNDMTVTASTDKERLTMYTCYPFVFIGSAPERYIVECDLIKVEG